LYWDVRSPLASLGDFKGKFIRMRFRNVYLSLALCILFLQAVTIDAKTGLETLPATISRIKPSVVGVGTFQETRRPKMRLLGTGFAVRDGNYIVTNAHVIPEELDEKHQEFLAVFSGTGKNGVVHPATVVRMDSKHDLCLLWFTGDALPPMTINAETNVKEGELYAFTGFPIGAALGLYPATHRGIISAITPIAIPVRSGGQLNGSMVNRLKEPYPIFQLDATAYPGNSGSPLYDIGTGDVIGIINMVFVKGTKESAITNPSGITYAIPSPYIHELIGTLNGKL
jgi:S1-C subfamily serine protease